MSYGGRGRGRGRGYGGGFRPGKQISWEPFPEIEDLGSAAGVVETLALAKWYSKLHSYWRASPYYYEGDNATSKGAKGGEIERFSDMITSKTKAKPPLSHFIRMEPDMFQQNWPESSKLFSHIESGEKKRPSKKVRWNPDSGLNKLDLFEKLEHKFQDQDGNEKKEGENEEEDEEVVDHEDSEYSDEGDYNQNVDFDDDDDDFNMAEDNDDGPMF